MGWTDATPEEESKAVGLYAVLSYDVGDFIDMLAEQRDNVLSVLHVMLATPNEKHNADTKELNALGADLVKGVLEKRGIKAEVEIPVGTQLEMSL